MIESRRRVAIEPAYVLHQYPYRNTSLLVEMVTQSYGRVALIAKGVRSAKSRFQGVLQPFQPLLVSWSGKGDLYTLVSAETSSCGPALSGAGLMSGLYMNELMMHLLHRHDPHASVFNIYQATICLIAEADSHYPGRHNRATAMMWHERALRLFEKALLSELGYGLILDHDVESGEGILAGREYAYLPMRGPVLLENAAGTGVQISGRSLLAFKGDDLEDAIIMQETKRLMRTVIDSHLGGKPLNSRAMFAGMMAVSSEHTGCDS